VDSDRLARAAIVNEHPNHGVIIGNFEAVGLPRAREVGPEAFGIETQKVLSRFLLFPTGGTLRFNRATAIPLLGQGDCLAPWLVEGDVAWYDPTIEPLNGDLVAVMMEYRRLSGGGDRVRLIAVKQLQISGSRRFLVCNQGCVMTDNVEMLGTVTAWRRPGWWRRPSVRKMRLPIQLGGANWLRSDAGQHPHRRT
jgi:hypothetical protein